MSFRREREERRRRLREQAFAQGIIGLPAGRIVTLGERLFPGDPEALARFRALRTTGFPQVPFQTGDIMVVGGDGDAIPGDLPDVPDLCPTGFRRNIVTGRCDPIIPPPPGEDEPPCPEGFEKNPLTGECVPIIPPPPPPPPCPPGFHRDAGGECVPDKPPPPPPNGDENGPPPLAVGGAGILLLLLLAAAASR